MKFEISLPMYQVIMAALNDGPRKLTDAVFLELARQAQEGEAAALAAARAAHVNGRANSMEPGDRLDKPV